MTHRASGPAILGSKSGTLWLGVGWAFSDCIATLQSVAAAELPTTGGDGGRKASGGSAVTLVDKLSHRLFNFKRGELVVIKSPWEPRRRLVRRLIGVEGDFVSVAGGKVERVPKGGCWLEADSGLTAAGGDSRAAWGPVPLALIEGRVSRVLWPPSRWGTQVAQPSPSGTRVVGKGGSLEIMTPPSDRDGWWS